MRKIICLLTIGCIPISMLAQQSWSTTGNAGTNANTNFIGTKDATDLVFKANSVEVGRILNAGSAWRFGTSNNFARFDPNGELSFGGTGVYKVGGNKYVFQSAGNIKYGMFFNSTTPQYEFRNGNAVSVFSINANNGNSYIAGKLGIGTNTPTYNLDIAGNLRVGITGPDYSTFDNKGNLHFSGSAAHLVDHNQFALLCNGEPLEGLYMNGNPNQWEFRDEAGSPFVILNVQSHLLTSRGGLQIGSIGPDYSTFDNKGNLLFSGAAAHLVNHNQFALLCNGEPNEGLYMNGNPNQWEFRDEDGVPYVTLNVGTYDVAVKGGVKVGFSNTAVAGNIRFNGDGFDGFNGTSWQTFSTTSSQSADNANQSLSNLTTTAVNVHLLPSVNNSLDLGSSGLAWRNAYVAGQLNASSILANKTSGNAISGITTGNGYGLYGKGGTYGIYGEGPVGVVGGGPIGVKGEGSSNNLLSSTYGVYGSAFSALAYSYGVYGTGGSHGVYGSGSSYGVYGDGGATGFGIYGIAGNYPGIFGGSTNGVGVSAASSTGNGLFATTYNNISQYAGYFNGDIVAGGYFYLSDRNLKKNIKDLSGALIIINKLHPTEYEFRQDGNYKLMNLETGNHYGLIAQEVEKVLPDLIKESKFDPNIAKPKKEDADNKNKDDEKIKEEVVNFKAVNYVEMIPIIIKGIQELSKANDEKDAKIENLQKQIDELKTLIKSSKIQSNGNQQTVELSVTAKLEQNMPNPFSNTTTIGYNLSKYKTTAFINFYNSSGKLLKSIKLNSEGKGTINVKANELPSGIYQYSLVIDGKIIDTKQMIQIR